MKMLSVGLLLVGGLMSAFSVGEESSTRRLSSVEESQLTGGGGWTGKHCVYLQSNCAVAGPKPDNACPQGAASVWACYTSTDSESCNTYMFSNECFGDSTVACPDKAVFLKCPTGQNPVWEIDNVQPPGAPGCGVYRNCI